jgi:hypothetical protein
MTGVYQQKGKFLMARNIINQVKIVDTLLVVLSDMHTGSSTALFPRGGFVNSEGNRVSPNQKQQEIYPTFIRLTGEVAKARKGKRLIVVNLGDAVDGFHHGSMQESLFKANDQCDAHIELMSEFLKRASFGKGDELYYVRGTETHVGETENDTAKALGAVPVEGVTDKKLYVNEILSLTINGMNHVFAHHGKERGSGQNEGNSLRNFLRNIRNDRIKDGLPEIDVLWSGHTHGHTWSDHIERRSNGNFHQMHGIICPSRQAKTRYALGKVPMAVNSIGGVYTRITADGVMTPPQFVVQTTEDR